MKKAPFIIVLFLCFSMTIIFADDAAGRYNPKMGTFQISQEDNIEMTSEVVDIWNSKVIVSFKFKNLTDQAQSVTIGFPVMDYPPRSWGPGSDYEAVPVSDDDYDKIEKYYEFKSTCNGKPLKRELVRNEGAEKLDRGKYVYWFKATLDFKPGETLEVTNEYKQRSDSYGDSMGGRGWTIKYILKSGASWAGPIKKAVINYHSRDYSVINNKSAFSFDSLRVDTVNYRFSYEPADKKWDKENKEAVVRWELINIEPRQDLEIEMYSIEEQSTSAILAWYLLVKNNFLKINKKYTVDETMNGLGYYEGSNWLDKYAHNLSKEKYKRYLVTFYNDAFSAKPAVSEKSEQFARYIINALYALQGYRFKNQAWTDLFGSFGWYEPNDNAKLSFSEEEKKIIQELKKYR